MGAGVIWSSRATKLLAEDPPNSRNYMVNSSPVDKLSDDPDSDQMIDIDDPATSLYQLQLQARTEPNIIQQILGIL